MAMCGFRRTNSEAQLLLATGSQAGGNGVHFDIADAR